MAIETRKGLYILAQSIGNHAIVFFDYFNTIEQFINIKLENINILCCITATGNFFQKSTIVKLNCKPLNTVSECDKQNRLFIPCNRNQKRANFVVYKNTENELEVPHINTGDLCLADWKYQIIKELDINKDIEIIEK
jgi:hypothetical protein